MVGCVCRCSPTKTFTQCSRCAVGKLLVYPDRLASNNKFKREIVRQSFVLAVYCWKWCRKRAERRYCTLPIQLRRCFKNDMQKFRIYIGPFEANIVVQHQQLAKAASNVSSPRYKSFCSIRDSLLSCIDLSSG